MTAKKSQISTKSEKFSLTLHLIMQCTMTRSEFIAKHRNLFWYTPDNQLHSISDSLIVEVILNDGTLDDFRELLDTLGAKHVAEVFFAATGRQKANYYPEIYHFFSLVLQKYA